MKVVFSIDMEGNILGCYYKNANTNLIGCNYEEWKTKYNDRITEISDEPMTTTKDRTVTLDWKKE